MKRYLGIFVAVGFVLFAIIFASSKWSAKVDEGARDASTARIKNDYLERVGWIRSNPDDKSYRDEVGTFLRWYFTQVTNHLNQHGGNREFNDYLLDLEKKSERGGKEQQASDRKSYFEYTKKFFDLLKSGNYSPVWTGSDKGMRLDVVSTDTVMADGQPQIRFQLAVWGAQRELREDGKVKKMATSAAFNVTWKMYDEKDVLVAEMNAPGDPAMKVDYPERFIEWFPPQMVIGHFDIDLVPANVKRVEIVFNVNSHAASGGDVAGSYLWKLDAPAEWKLREGQEWKGAQESVRPAEEIDPNGALKKNARK
ncbi:MAG: hypothetical protein ACYC8T_05260 [Myxococcaceae bacterium]